ncbi:MAG: hydrogenase maturation nickel metallochaperone HypA [Bacteroidales bacterium]|jgi:hydrogenase nickel incorporation protein HypA/HybF|nr:hydrogenase maturation nickel metallochaperone HypA [Bacteroidales bacterium]
MHELSIAMNIVEIVEEHSGGKNGQKISAVELDIGDHSGVIIEALQFALEEAVKSSVLENARIIINRIPAICKCLSCKYEFVPEDIITPCPECGHLYAEVIQGKEMKIKKIIF